MKTIFIFGAGASHSAHEKDLPKHMIPPLTKDLFQGCNQYDIHYAKEIGLNINDLNYIEDESANFTENGGTNIEKWLTEKWEKAKIIKDDFHRKAEFNNIATITFYIWVTLLKISESVYRDVKNCRGSNMYRRLLKKIHDKKINFGIINFNYDLLLDLAFRDVFNVDLQNEYVSTHYIKPHGSVNWFLNKKTESDLENVIDSDPIVKVRTAMRNMYNEESLPLSNLTVLDPENKNLYSLIDIFKTLNTPYFLPLIFLPLTSKDYSLVSGFEKIIMDNAKKMIKDASEIYLIGYRANDKIILDLLNMINSSNVKIHIVNTNDVSARKIREKLLKKFPNKIIRGTINSNGFPDFVHNF
ncbi:MAG: hypothetical protein KBD46_03825 [Candidatus Levybacteria bacterium]|nr:hypothetical protein [Candidatus Levybacteria bacterium]